MSVFALIRSALEAIAALPQILEQMKQAFEQFTEWRRQNLIAELQEVTARLEKTNIPEDQKFDIASQLQNITRRL